MSTAHISKEYLDGLRKRFDTGRGPITMGELDALITFAQESEKFRTDVTAWIEAVPNIGGGAV